MGGAQHRPTREATVSTGTDAYFFGGPKKQEEEAPGTTWRECSGRGGGGGGVPPGKVRTPEGDPAAGRRGGPASFSLISGFY